MPKSACRILKNSDIKLEGQFHLNQTQCAKPSQNDKNSASAVANVRIVENHPQYAILEVTCSCGTKTHVKCQYNIKSQ